MAKLLVTYDLSEPGQNYNDLYALIRTYAHTHITESSWGISTDKTVAEVRDHLKQALDNNDKLFITRMNGWASHGLPKSVTDWLHNN